MMDGTGVGEEMGGKEKKIAFTIKKMSEGMILDKRNDFAQARTGDH